jgi:SLT domain-containing protein
VALLVAAGVAIYAFRDQVGAAINAIVELYKQFFTMIYNNFIKPYMDAHAALTQYIVENFIKPTATAISNFATAAYKYINTNFIEPAKKVFTAVTTFISEKFIKPVQDTITGMIKNIGNAFQSLKEAIVAPFKAAMDIVKGIVNNILNGIVRAISFMIAPINAIIAHANKLGNITRQPKIDYLQPPQFSKFAQGGVVDSPTLAMVGEGNEREYIIPESKMARASANYLGGMRGNAAIQSQGNSRSSSPTIQIQTGPVLQQNNQQYVTIADMEKALTMLTDSLLLNNRTFGGRSYQGVGA